MTTTLACQPSIRQPEPNDISSFTSGDFLSCVFLLSRRRFAAALLPRLFWNGIPGHTTRAPQLGFELATNGIQFHVIANLDKTSLSQC